MISSPLFIIVAESIVIFAPIDQFGCFSAFSFFTFFSFSAGVFLKGPPEAVSSIFFISPCFPDIRLWNIAECSESTGMSSQRFSRTASVNRCPAQTRVSLFARAILRPPSSIAAIVGRSPEIPTIAETTVSVSSFAASIMPSSPESTFTSVSRRRTLSSFAAVSSAIAAILGWNRLACDSISLKLLPAVSAVTHSPSLPATSRV